MDLNAYLTSQRDTNDEMVINDRSFPLAKRIKCKDGFSLSVQATHGAYCSPRHNIGPWYEVEVGFPSAQPELIMQYAEQSDQPTQTVYGYVPIQLVEQLIDLHGGQEGVNPNDVITTMAQQREQERAADVAHYMLRKACEARAVELYEALLYETGRTNAGTSAMTYDRVDALIKEIDDASH